MLRHDMRRKRNMEPLTSQLVVRVPQSVRNSVDGISKKEDRTVCATLRRLIMLGIQQYEKNRS